jgi:Domain of unknown function (DUF6894)
MVRYLFHVMGDGRVYRDEVGRRFDSLEPAKEHAVVIARELAMDGEAYWGFTVYVIDDLGNEVARVPVGKDVS